MPKRNKKIQEAGEDGSEVPAPQQPASQDAMVLQQGRSGQGAQSAMAHLLIEQEQAPRPEPDGYSEL